MASDPSGDLASPCTNFRANTAACQNYLAGQYDETTRHISRLVLQCGTAGALSLLAASTEGLTAAAAVKAGGIGCAGAVSQILIGY